jgi:2'-carboxy-2,3-dihydroxybiphenyl 1,2-dioxygenase small subunit/ferredoxin
MTVHISIDRETCQGYGNCVLIAEDIFAIEDDGRAGLKTETVEDSLLTKVQAAEYDCPTGAISVERRDGDAGSG